MGFRAYDDNLYGGSHRKAGKSDICQLRKKAHLPCNDCIYFAECRNVDSRWRQVQKIRNARRKRK